MPYGQRTQRRLILSDPGGAWEAFVWTCLVLVGQSVNSEQFEGLTLGLVWLNQCFWGSLCSDIKHLCHVRDTRKTHIHNFIGPRLELRSKSRTSKVVRPGLGNTGHRGRFQFQHLSDHIKIFGVRGSIVLIGDDRSRRVFLLIHR